MGLGLGLTISRAIVRSHGGILSCSNRAPHGARFTFDLPVRPGAGMAVPATPQAGDAAGGEAA